MASQKLILEPGNFYHIYNRGINSCAIFKETSNFEHFLRLYDKYIDPVCDTYAWVLMGNHFHFLIRVRSIPEDFQNLQGLTTAEYQKRITQQFSNLFNAYTKAFNKRYNRTGSLFEHTFRRKLIDNKEYLKQLILYIHNNPVHHGFCKHPIEYPWSSYLSCVSIKPTKLHREVVVGWFDGEANFIAQHQENMDVDKMEIELEI